VARVGRVFPLVVSGHQESSSICFVVQMLVHGFPFSNDYRTKTFGFALHCLFSGTWVRHASRRSLVRLERNAFDAFAVMRMPGEVCDARADRPAR